jgi:hypothetical protein
MKTWLRHCSRGALILLLTVGAAWAQGTAQLSSTVRDESNGPTKVGPYAQYQIR